MTFWTDWKKKLAEHFLRWGKRLKYSDLGENKKQKEIVRNKIEESLDKGVDYDKLEREWEQVEQTIQDIFYNLDNYTGYDSLGQKPIDSRLLEKYMYNKKERYE